MGRVPLRTVPGTGITATLHVPSAKLTKSQGAIYSRSSTEMMKTIKNAAEKGRMAGSVHSNDIA
jgi:hypothetical protein